MSDIQVESQSPSSSSNKQKKRRQKSSGARFDYLAHPAAVQQGLAEHAKEIRKLGKRAIEDIIEIGRRLTEAKKLVGYGHWGNWLEKEFGWSPAKRRTS